MTYHEDDAGWEALSGRVRGTAPEIPELEVARLRRRVREAAPVAAGWRSHALALATGLAATILLGVTTIGGLVGLRPVTAARGAGAGELLQVARAQDGSVIIRYADGTPVRRVLQSTKPKPNGESQVRLARNGQVVDAEDAVSPGTVVFYRVD